jgi:phosphoribosyl-AMP cyclohydrolase
MTTLDPQVAALLKDPELLIPAIVQDSNSKEVLMLAYMNPESLQLTLSTGKATYWSRSRSELWVKGETSGHYQQVQSITLDCDGDALLLEVVQTGVACHTGERTCFHTPLELRS